MSTHTPSDEITQSADSAASANSKDRLDGKASTQAFLREMTALGPRVGLAAALCLSLPALVGFLVIGSVLADDGGIREWLSGWSYWSAVLGFGAGFAVLSGSAIAPTYALSFACGVLFGPVAMQTGTDPLWADTSELSRIVGCGLAAMLGVGIGSFIGYGWGILLARSKVMEAIEANDRARAIRDGIQGRGPARLTWLVGLVRFPPNSPFALTNLVMSAVHVPIVPYVIGTVAGIAPRTLLAVFLGVQAGSFSELDGKSKWIVLISTAITVVVFVIVYRILSGWVKEALSTEFGSSASEASDAASSSRRT